MGDAAENITGLIESLNNGDRKALERLMPLVYEQLRLLARKQMVRRSQGVTLSPTGLVHETFERLKKKEKLSLSDRKHFFCVAARCMRWILLDHAKAKKQAKRGGWASHVEFDETFHVAQKESFDVVELDRVLTKLEHHDERLCRLVELRFLTGLTIDETAEALGMSAATVSRDWQLAKAWLMRELSANENED